MEKINGLTNALAEFVEEYAEVHDLTITEVMNAMAHIYVIYGFALKSDNVTEEQMGTTLVEVVEIAIQFMRALKNAEEA